VALHGYVIPSHTEPVARPELTNAFEQVTVPSTVSEYQVFIHLLNIEFARKVGMRQERLDLGREEKRVPLHCPVERLDPEMVTSNVDLLLLEIHNHNREHSVETFEHSFKTVPLV